MGQALQRIVVIISKNTLLRRQIDLSLSSLVMLSVYALSTFKALVPQLTN